MPGVRSSAVDESLHRIVAAMVTLFGVSEREAVARVARRFGTWELCGAGPGAYADVEFWACRASYGAGSTGEPVPWV
jgi:hypothetical protein